MLVLCQAAVRLNGLPAVGISAYFSLVAVNFDVVSIMPKSGFIEHLTRLWAKLVDSPLRKF